MRGQASSTNLGFTVKPAPPRCGGYEATCMGFRYIDVNQRCSRMWIGGPGSFFTLPALIRSRYEDGPGNFAPRQHSRARHQRNRQLLAARPRQHRHQHRHPPHPVPPVQPLKSRGFQPLQSAPSVIPDMMNVAQLVSPTTAQCP